MKKFLMLFLLPFIFSCGSYHDVQLTADTPIYNKQTSPDSFDTIAAGQHVMIQGNETTKYRRLKYKGTKGYAVNPEFKKAK